MDFGNILGALINGAVTPPRRRAAPRGRGAFGMTVTQERQIGRVLGGLATVAIEAMRTPSAPAPKPAAPPRDIGPAPRIPSTGIPSIGIPTTGASPWAPRPGIPVEPPAPRDEPASEHAEAVLLTQAMIAAARADGVTDAAERTAISRQLDAAGLTTTERDHVLASFDSPATPEALARDARDPMLRAQLYAACVAAMGEITPPERAWLDRLGAALKLDAAARSSIEKRLG